MWTLLVGLHQRIGLNQLRKSPSVFFNHGGVTPRFRLDLGSNFACKAATPPKPRPRLCYMFDRVAVHERREGAAVVKESRLLNQPADPRYCARASCILVSDDGFADQLRLCSRRAKLDESRQGELAAVELKRHERRVAVLVRRTDVVQKASESPGLKHGSRSPGGEVLQDDCTACQLSA